MTITPSTSPVRTKCESHTLSLYFPAHADLQKAALSTHEDESLTWQYGEETGRIWPNPRYNRDDPAGVRADPWLCAANGLGPFSAPTMRAACHQLYSGLEALGRVNAAEDNAHLDERNLAILAKRAIARAQLRRRSARPLVGDVAYDDNGRRYRFSHKWEDGLQISDGGSYYITASGAASMSGGLYPLVRHEMIEPTERAESASFWFFRDDISGAHRGLDVVLSVPVWRVRITDPYDRPAK